MLPKNYLGNTGIEVTILGYGAGQTGDLSIPEKEIEILLNSVIDNGINFIDTAKGYHASEERIGKFLSYRRKDFILSTKAGYGIEGIPDWTYECIIAGIEKALRTMKTDYIDVVHLHSCPLYILTQGDVINALHKCVNDGKVRCAAYSGENEELEFAVTSGLFTVVQTSINIFDQGKLDSLIPAAMNKNIGVIGKRALGNTPWKFSERPVNDYSEIYWERMKKMQLDFGNEWNEIALRFSLFTPGVTTCITGTRNINHIIENISYALKGKLPDDLYNEIRNRFRSSAENWRGQV